MDVHMHATIELEANGGLARPPDEAPDVISPELALVDPDLRDRARAALSTAAVPSAPRLVSVPSPIESIPKPIEPEPADDVTPAISPERPVEAPVRSLDPDARTASSSVRPRRAALAVGATLGLTFVALAFLGVMVVGGGEDDPPRSASASGPSGAANPGPFSGPESPRSGQPKRAGPSAASASKPSKSKRGARPSQAKAKSAPSRRATSPPANRRFAWAPVAGAIAYHVELFRGSSRVFAARTRRPEISLQTGWRFEGRRQTLTRGNYLWYVWPVYRATGRASAASVQARLRVG
jgi:hypothetical protein